MPIDAPPMQTWLALAVRGAQEMRLAANITDIIRRALVAGAAALLLAGCLPGGVSKPASDSKPSGASQHAEIDPIKDPFFFYRMKADYKIRSTGEVLNFDFVVSCGGRIESWSYTSSSLLTGMAPHLMLMPTRKGEAVGVSVPDLCDGRAFQPHIGVGIGPELIPGGGAVRKGAAPVDDIRVPDLIPDDFMPLAYWYPSADDLSFSLAYASEHAYESPYRKMDFLGATIEPSNADEWKAWRERAKASYSQIGALPGPWGLQYPGTIGSSDEEDLRIIAQNHGRPPNRSCFGATKVKVPDEVRPEFDAFMKSVLPEGERYLLMSDYHDDVYDSLQARAYDLLRKRSAAFGGGTLNDHGSMKKSDVALGIARRDGGGIILRTSELYVKLNPEALPVHRAWLTPTKTADGKTNGRRRSDILTDPAWRGFFICSLNPASYALPDVQAYVEGAKKWQIPDYSRPEQYASRNETIASIGGTVIGKPFSIDSNTTVFDAEGYVFLDFDH